MYPTSQRYREIMYGHNSRETELNLSLTLTDGKIINVDNNDVKIGSFCVDMQALGDIPLCVGDTYMAEVTVEIKRKTERYSIDPKYLKDALMFARVAIKLSDTEEEIVPVGLYTVNNVQVNDPYLKLKLYDNMTRFERPIQFGPQGKIVDTPYNLLSKACEECKVPLNIDQSYVDSISPTVDNGSGLQLATVQIGKIAGISMTTYRDILYCVGQVTMSACYIDRAGGLTLKRFDYAQNKAPVVEINDRIRKKATILAQGVKGTRYQWKFPGNRTVVYTRRNRHQDPILFMGAYPTQIANLKDNSLPSWGQVIKPELESFMGDQMDAYTPASVEFIGDPAIDIGDCVLLTGKDCPPEGIRLYVQSVRYKHHGTQTLSSIGNDIERSKILSDNFKTVEKDTSAVIEDKSEKNMRIITTEKDLHGQDALLCSFQFSTNDVKSPATLTGTLSITCATAGVYEVLYKRDSHLFTNNLKFSALAGQIILVPVHIYIHADYIPPNSTHTMELLLRKTGGTTDGSTVGKYSTLILSGQSMLSVKSWSPLDTAQEVTP